MRAAIFHGAGQPVAIEQRPDPEPGAGEVVIRIGRCGVCGTDLHRTSGHSRLGLPPGSMFGHEFAGEVVALGKDVSRLKIGDRITAMPLAGCGACAACELGYPINCVNPGPGASMGFAEFLAVAESSAAPLPRALSLADGALVEPLSVGLHGVSLAAMPPGARVLVIGAGAVGLAAVFWSRRMGAGKILASSPSRRRAEMALMMGADSFEALGEGETERFVRALGGAPDVVFECAGAIGSLEKSIEHVRTGGTVVSLGFCTAPDPISPHVATLKQVTIRFSMLYTLREFQHCIDMLDRGHVEPRSMISQTVSLDDFPDILERMRNGMPHTKVQVAP